MDRILGQSHALNVLQSAVDVGKVHHAWIFHGPKGVGKFTTAREFAKLLLDPECSVDLTGSKRVEPGSRVSRLIESNNHPDFHIIRKEDALFSSVRELTRQKLTNIPIDLLRERMIGGVTRDDKFHEARVALAPSMKHGKVFIIDEAELLEPISQNAILKTLEEPPPRTYIILITTQPDQLLPTIRSRCQRASFTLLDAESMARWYASSDLNLDDERREWVIQFADGAPGLAMLAVEDGMFDWYAKLVPMIREVESGRYPPKMGEMLAGFVETFADAYVKKYDNASKEMANSDGSRRVLLLLASHARARLRAALDGVSDADPVLELIDYIRETEFSLDRHVNMKLVWENLVVQWTNVRATECVS